MTMRGRRRSTSQLAVVALAAGLLMAVPLPARPAVAAGIAPSAGGGSVDATGRFTTSVPIEVPAFRGLEPSLSLRYDSGTGNGFVGVGWTLTGVSVVERAGPGRGVPRYDSADIFLLDGQELLACTTLGGTHCPRQQSFQRVRRDTANNRWEVWDSDGTKSVYSSVYATGRGTFRWALTSETDTHGNTVSYAYTGVSGTENAYLDSISYNGTVIRLWRESRPDAVSFTNGEFVGRTTRRLKTVEVSTGGQRVRVYRLAYQQAGDPNRSVLASVRQYGRDATVDGSGTVTGGTALPAVTLGYQDGVSRFEDQISSSRGVGDWGSTTNRDLFGDVNGDGRTDLVRVHQDGSDARARVSISDGVGYPAPASDAVVGPWNIETTDQLADVNGDGRADLVRLGECAPNTCARVRLSDGDGFPNQSFLGSVGTWNPTYMRDFLTDVDGDYRADFVRLWKNGSDVWVQVNRSNGSGFPDQDCNTPVGTWHDSTKWYFADVNGDGLSDMVRVYNLGNGNTNAAVRRSDGRCFPVQTFNSTIGGWNTDFQYHFNDLNADGKADLVVLYEQSPGNAYAQVNLTDGLGYPAQTSNSPVGTWNPDSRIDRFGDVNGDGRTDLVRFYNGADGDTYAMIRPFDGHDFADESYNERIGGSFNAAYKYNLVDVSGDGKADSVRIHHIGSGLASASVYLATGPTPDLLTSIGNGIGGTVGISYAPSSRWWADAADPIPSVFPTVASVTRGDGRGTSFTTQYSYADARWARQPDERRFLGYGSSTAVIDGDGTRQVTLYRQTPAGAGEVAESSLRNAAGAIYHRIMNSYVETGSPPYASQLSSTSRFDCNLSSLCREARTDFGYDIYNNRILEVDHGDTYLTGDELTTAVSFSPNTSAFVVSSPATRTQYAGTSTSGTQLTRRVYFYDGAATSTTQPVKGDLTRTDEWNSTTGGYVTTSSGYDAYGNVTSATDARGFTSTSVFDATYHLFATRSCNALTQCTDTAWDYVLGQPSTVTDPNGAVTGHSYDPLGRAVTRTDPAGNVTRWEYLDLGDPARQRVRETLPDGSGDGLWSESYADGLGREYQTVKEGPSAGVTYVQDRVYRSVTTQVWKQSLWRTSGQPAVYTVTDHDGADRPVKITHPDGAYTTTTYAMRPPPCNPCPLVGFPTVATADELGHRRVSLSDTDGNLTTVDEINGTSTYTTRYSHDPLGRLVRWTDAAGNASTVAYNSLGWKTSMTDMDTGTWTYTYDNGGLVSSQTDARGQTTSFGYDQLSRRTTLTYPGGVQARWFYDEPGRGASIGRLTRTTYPAGSDEHNWDARGLETSTTQCVDAVCKTLSSTYDPLGRLATLTYPDGENVSHGYDAAGRLSTVAGYVTSMAWNPAGQLTALTYPNGTTTTYTYDARREWLATATVVAGAATRYQATYGYNAAGLVTTMTQGTPTATTTAYTYDDLNRLLTVTGAQSQTFAYDPIGNITTNSVVGTYVYGDVAHKHAVTAAGSASYTYDPNGNQLSGDGRTMTWDGANRLASVTQAGTTTFAYDAGETRIKKTSPTGTTRYFGKLLEEVNGTLVKYHYAGPILVARSTGATKTWYHADRLGSTRLMTNATGTEARDYDYKPFGDLQSTSGTATNERDYTGHIRDTETGLLYMGARYQDPMLGRFISPDSVIPDLANPQNISRYSYVLNNPLNKTDPSGHEPCPDGYCNWQKDHKKAQEEKRKERKRREAERAEETVQNKARRGDMTKAREAEPEIPTQPDEVIGLNGIPVTSDPDYEFVCATGPGGVGPPNCSYHWVGPTVSAPTYCVGLCKHGVVGVYGMGHGELEVDSFDGGWGQLVTVIVYNPGSFKQVQVREYRYGQARVTALWPHRAVAFQFNVFDYQPIHRQFTLSWSFPILGVDDPNPAPLQYYVCSNNCGPPTYVKYDRQLQAERSGG